MRFNATVRRKRGPTAEMKILHASEIKEAAEIVRAKYDLYGDDPHKGFTVRSLTSKGENGWMKKRNILA